MMKLKPKRSVAGLTLTASPLVLQLEVREDETGTWMLFSGLAGCFARDHSHCPLLGAYKVPGPLCFSTFAYPWGRNVQLSPFTDQQTGVGRLII